MIDFAAAREIMVDSQVRPSDVTRYPIIEAMLSVPRENFVPAAMKPVAYLGEHVPIAPGRVLLDPRVFAKMLDALNVGPGDHVLDVGAGLGYAAAVLARLSGSVVALEEDAGLAADARAALDAEGAEGIVVQVGPLAAGAAGQGPYDAMLIAGGIEMLPAALAGQMKDGGRIAAIFVTGPQGQARLGTVTSQGIVWRRMFDAFAPVLPGFVAAKAFEF